MLKKILLSVVILAALAGAGFWYWHLEKTPRSYFRYAEVHRGRLVATVGSTGTLMPREIVDVGAQVQGRIIAIGKDPSTQSKIVDWGSEVVGPILDKDGKITEPGTVLAKIDPDIYEAQLKSAAASLKAAQADYEVKKASLGQASADWSRAQLLYAQPDPKGIAKAEYDSYQAAFGSATAALGQSAANIDVAKAQLKLAQTNLNYTTITSPVNGIVIDRRVNVGQTVVASLSAPSLFLIAKDLTKMEVWATVNEVDVGKLKVRQPVKFTVDALPGKSFRGEVVPQGKLPFRYNVTMNQNVVTYTAVVSADNSSGLFRPYWTTNLSFIVADKKDALLVPNAALRWQPSKQQMAPAVAADYAAQRAKKPTTADGDVLDHGFVWVKGEDGLCHFIHLQLGLSDTVNTEVLGVVGGGDLSDKTKVITGESRTELSTAASNNPFVTPLFKKKEGS